MLLDLGTWVPILDGDPIAAAMYERHYSSARSLARRRERGTMQFGGSGSRMVLMTPCRRALFVWRLQNYRLDDLVGVECSIFRNEGAGRSSSLIRDADRIAFARWPRLAHFTFVDAEATAAGRSAACRPGQCFRRAGWKPLRDEAGDALLSAKRGLNILVRLPPE